MTYVNTDLSLPKSLDVQISLSRAQAETRTNLSVLCVAGKDIGFLPDSTRIRYYSSMSSVAADFSSSSEAYKAANAFFSQSPRATTMAIGEIFEGNQPAMIVAGEISTAELLALKSITSGTLSITINDTAHSVTGLNFATCDTLDAIAAVVNTGLASTPSSAIVKTFPGGSRRMIIVTDASGDGITISCENTGSAAALQFTATNGGKTLNGYTPGTIADELDNIVAAANSNGVNVYGWCLDAGLRTVETQLLAAEWVVSKVGIMPLVTNDISAIDSSVTTDLGSELKNTSNRRACALYHNDVNAYPDVSILAYMLSVNYQMQDSTVTAKFKQLPGISTVSLSESQWAALQAKGYNTYVSVGNAAKTYRDGTTEDTTYYMDSVINLDNFAEDLSVNVFNVFLRNGKIPYTRKGQMLLVNACQDTANQYTYNGTFASRPVTDTTSKSGVKILPAVDIIPTPINQMSVADRASRIGPPIELVCQEAGAIHSVAIAVEVIA